MKSERCQLKAKILVQISRALFWALIQSNCYQTIVPMDLLDSDRLHYSVYNNLLNELK